jgi:hypothetical protein
VWPPRLFLWFDCLVLFLLWAPFCSLAFFGDKALLVATVCCWKSKDRWCRASKFKEHVLKKVQAKSMFVDCSCPGHATWIKMGPYTSLHLVISTNSKIPHSQKNTCLAWWREQFTYTFFFVMHLLSKLHCIKRRNVTLPKYYFYIRFSYTDSSTDTKK